MCQVGVVKDQPFITYQQAAWLHPVYNSMLVIMWQAVTIVTGKFTYNHDNHNITWKQ